MCLIVTGVGVVGSFFAVLGCVGVVVVLVFVFCFVVGVGVVVVFVVVVVLCCCCCFLDPTIVAVAVVVSVFVSFAAVVAAAAAAAVVVVMAIAVVVVAYTSLSAICYLNVFRTLAVCACATLRSLRYARWTSSARTCATRAATSSTATTSRSYFHPRGVSIPKRSSCIVGSWQHLIIYMDARAVLILEHCFRSFCVAPSKSRLHRPHRALDPTFDRRRPRMHLRQTLEEEEGVGTARISSIDNIQVFS